MNIREENGEIFVEDISECQVGSLEQAMKIVNAGLMHREMGSHQMNETSSRSHTLLHIDVYQTRRTEQTNKIEHIHGRLVLADLAGSERVRKTTSTGIRLEEAKHINSSLSALGNVISSLANPRKNGQQFIPYRSSKLTRVLTNSLNYESKVVVLATLGPAKSSFHESLSTMQFA